MLKNCLRGFTLIELLVVAAIIAIVFTISLANYRGSQSKQSLIQAEQTLIANLRRAQNMAMSGSGINSNYFGYGIYAQKGSSSYLIFGGKRSANQEYAASIDVVIERINLPSGVSIANVSSVDDRFDVFFKPPDPITFIDNSSNSGVSGSITLQYRSDAFLIKTITINTSGLIQGN